MRAYLLICLLAFGFFGIAQENVNKPHYRLIDEGFGFTLNYEKALQHTQLDNLRYLNSRRIIPIEGTKISIELFSAQELFVDYGKPISPLTAKKLPAANDVQFKLSGNKYRLETIPNLPLNQGQNKEDKALSSKEMITTFFGGLLYDSGGPTGNYANNETYVKTIYSDNGESPYLSFTAFSTENHFDVMYIYDGKDSKSKLIGAYSGGNAPKLVQASGAYLTIVFVSDGSKTQSGWGAICGRGAAPPPPAPMSAPTCAQAGPFCSGTTSTFPATTGSTVGETGPDYGCLGSEPNPAWYYMQVANTGPIVLNVAGTGGGDVDFICWGPFPDATSPCDDSLTGGCGFGTPTNTTNSPCSGNIVDCSYSANATETCTMPNAIAGQWYMVMITNYSNQTQNITLNQSGGTGSTNCNIINCGVTAANTGPYCVGQTITLNGATTNTTATTYAWVGPNGFTSALQSPTITGATLAMAGTYSVTGTTGGTVTCVATTTVVINSSTPPTVTSSTICAGATGTVTASPPAGSYTWNTGATTATLTASPATTTVYTVTAGVGTCTSSATGSITVISNPVISVNSATICTGQTTTLTASGVTAYNWTPNTGLSSTTTSVVTASPPSTTVYTITGTVGACSAPAVTATVSVINAAVPTVSSNMPCAGQQALILNCTAAGLNYAWAGPNGFTSTVQTPTITSSNVTAATAGIYTLAVFDPVTTCTNVAFVNVTVNPLPIVTATSATICIGQSTGTLTANGASTYNWTSSTGGAPVGLSQIIPGNSTSMLANPPSSQSYIVVGQDANTCVGVGSCHVVVNSLPPVTATGASLCEATTGTLTANGALIYTWSPAGDLNTNTGSAVLVTPSTAATTTYNVIGQDANGCVNTATATVSVDSLPIVSITPSATTGCVPQCPTFSVSSIPAASAYSWSFGNGRTSTSSSPNPCFTTANTYAVKLTLTDIHGCKNTATASVITYPIPIPNFDYQPRPVTILEPNVTFINESTGLNITNYTWSFGDSLSTNDGDSSNIKNPSHTYLAVGTYPVSLIATSVHGCADTITRLIIIEQDFVLYVPNAFSPNGDGKNEVFKAEGEGILEFKMNIYDRWGNNIFTTTNINLGWDGRHAGPDILQQDVYVWKIDLKNASYQGKTYTGTVTLIK